MKFSFNFIFILFLAFSPLSAQVSDTDVLFTIDEDKVGVKEFLRVYYKNLELVKDPAQKEVDNYLDLYINYKLKIKEAKRLGYADEVSYQREFNSYKNQLTKNYLANNKVTESLLKESYERLKTDIKAVHILIRLEETEIDTAEVYKRLLDLKDELKNEDFQKLQAKYHDGTNMFVEDLGYFTAFKMVYPFETAAYNTPVGQVSDPFRTRFGFHIVKVLDKRNSSGEVTVSHIMVSNNQNGSTNPEQRINEIYRKIEQGESFENLAKQFSDDKGTSEKGGLMNSFSRGQLSSAPFEDASFSLNSEGEISKPFQTDYGWHVVRLENKKPLASFEEIKPELEVKIGRDSRSALIDKALIEDIKSQYNISVVQKELDYLKNKLSIVFAQQKWEIPSDFNASSKIAIIDTLSLYNMDFANYLIQLQSKYRGVTNNLPQIITDEFSVFLDQRILDYHRNNLENIDEDYAFVLNEYREGLLLFSLMENEIWNKATKDSIGLKKYYESNIEQYKWPTRYNGTIISAADKTDIERSLQLYKDGKTLSEIAQALNLNGNQKIFLTNGLFDNEHPLLSKDMSYKKGVSNIYRLDDSYAAAIFDSVIPASVKPLEEAMGKAISDYQGFLEEQWIEQLKKRYAVKVNSKVLNQLKQKIANENK